MTEPAPYRLRFWGVRGSIPSPGPATTRYGGNTACVTVEAPRASPVVLDAGTGIRLCGRSLEEAGVGEVVVLLSHTHWDHVQGFPWLPALYRAGATVRVTGPEGLGEGLERLLARPMWPLAVTARLEIRTVTQLATGVAVDGGFEVSGWSVRWAALAHPGPTLAYRLERPGSAVVAYATDNELGGGHGRGAGWGAELVDFMRGVHTLVHDATNAEDQLEARRGWGHSSALETVELAARAGCRRVVLFHYDPDHDDAMVDAMLGAARRHAAVLAPSLMVEAAHEGMTLTLEQEE